MKIPAVLLVLGLCAGVVMRSSDSPAPERPASGALVQTISTGKSVDLEDHLESGEWTLVEFTADW